jgi:hypothetical protein
MYPLCTRASRPGAYRPTTMTADEEKPDRIEVSPELKKAREDQRVPAERSKQDDRIIRRERVRERDEREKK